MGDLLAIDGVFVQTLAPEDPNVEGNLTDLQIFERRWNSSNIRVLGVEGTGGQLQPALFKNLAGVVVEGSNSAEWSIKGKAVVVTHIVGKPVGFGLLLLGKASALGAIGLFGVTAMIGANLAEIEDALLDTSGPQLAIQKAVDVCGYLAVTVTASDRSGIATFMAGASAALKGGPLPKGIG